MKRITLLILTLCMASGLFAQDFDLLCGNLNYKPEVQTVLLYADDNQLNDPIVPLEDMMGRLTLSFDIIDGDGEVLLHLHPLHPRLDAYRHATHPICFGL
jgi:hypothetical protein